ncbi:uncharacterized protein [Symphalangus syndactylus]|uniref:uncharacterized protein n=1 Tax=Symphalangus syndactylus TaxID=9590 RepID=UPI0030062264
MAWEASRGTLELGVCLKENLMAAAPAHALQLWGCVRSRCHGTCVGPGQELEPGHRCLLSCTTGRGQLSPGPGKDRLHTSGKACKMPAVRGQVGAEEEPCISSLKSDLEEDPQAHSPHGRINYGRNGDGLSSTARLAGVVWPASGWRRLGWVRPTHLVLGVWGGQEEHERRSVGGVFSVVNPLYVQVHGERVSTPPSVSLRMSRRNEQSRIGPQNRGPESDSRFPVSTSCVLLARLPLAFMSSGPAAGTVWLNADQLRGSPGLGRGLGPRRHAARHQ